VQVTQSRVREAEDDEGDGKYGSAYYLLASTLNVGESKRVTEAELLRDPQPTQRNNKMSQPDFSLPEPADSGNTKKPWVTVVPSDYLRATWLSAPAKLLGCILQSYANRDGIAYPSLWTLERDSNLEIRTVRRYMKELEASGFIKTLSKPKGPKGENARYLVKIQQYQKRPTSTTHIPAFYDGAISGVSSDGMHYERRIGNKIKVIPILRGIKDDYGDECLGTVFCECYTCIRADTAKPKRSKPHAQTDQTDLPF